jgi:uncharacterized protein (DUF1778 family)
MCIQNQQYAFLVAMAALDKTEKRQRSEVVNMRIDPNQLDLIDAAASLCGKSRSAFMLEAAYRAAQCSIADCSVLAMSSGKPLTKLSTLRQRKMKR